MSDLRAKLEKLTPKQRALFELLQKQQQRQQSLVGERVHAPAPKAIDASRPMGLLPASFPQRHLWALHRVEPTSTFAYNVHLTVRLRGPLEVPLFERALHEVLSRHESLRSTIHSDGGLPVLVIHPELTLSLPVIDLRALPAAQQLEEIDARARATSLAPFDLERAPLMRATLLHLGKDDHVALLTMHHMVIDRPSLGIVVRELMICYRGLSAGRPVKLPPPPLSYSDFARWQHDHRDDDRERAHQRYWLAKLGSSPPRLELPLDRPRPAHKSYRGAREHLSIPQPITRALKVAGAARSASLFMVFLAAYKVLLHGLSGQLDLTIGTLVTSRSRAELEQIVGFLFNTLVLRTDLSGDPTFAELLHRVRTTRMEAYDHASTPYERVLAALRPARQLGRDPLFDVMFSFQNEPRQDLAVDNLRSDYLPVDPGSSKCDLLLDLREDSDCEVAGWLEYDTDLFDHATIANLSAQLLALLTRLCTTFDDRLSALAPTAPAPPTRVAAPPSAPLTEEPARPRDEEAGRVLAELWRELLGVERVEACDNFFALGGSPLLALQMEHRATQRGLALPAALVFEHPTLAALARASVGLAQYEDVPLAPNHSWFVETFDPEQHNWATTIAWDVPPAMPVDLERLRAALRALSEHHDVLRLLFHRQGDHWRARLSLTPPPPAVELVELRSTSQEERTREVEDRARELQATLSIVHGPVIAFRLCRSSTDTLESLIIALHHTIYDAYSLEVLFEDLVAIYRQLGSEKSAPIPPPPTSYGQYLRAMQALVHSPKMASSRAFWLAAERMRTLPPMPRDFPDGTHTVRTSRRHEVLLAPDMLARIRGWLGAEPTANLNELLLYGLTSAYARWSGTSALRLDFEHNGRVEVVPELDLSRMVGPTTLKVPLLLEFFDAEAPAEGLSRIQRTVRETMRHAAAHGLLRYGGEESARAALASCGAPQLFLNNRGIQAAPVPLGAAYGSYRHLVLERADGGDDVVSYDLMIEGDNTAHGPTLTWVYSSSIHREATIARLAQDTLESITRLLRGHE